MCWGDNTRPSDDVGSYYCPYWGCISWATWQKAEHAAPFARGQLPDCTPGTCNPVNFIILMPSDCEQRHILSIRIDGKGLDPRTLMHIKLVTITRESSSYQVYHSFYEEMRSEFFVSIKAKTLFLLLAES
jgi:hypothetical protein